MTIPTEPRTSRLYHASELAAGSVFSAGRAVAVLLAAFGGYIVIATVFAAAHADLLVTIMAGEAMLVLVPLAFVRATGGHRAMLGLRWPERQFVIAALLLGVSQWFLNLVLVDALSRVFDLSGDGVDRLQQVAVDPPLALSLLAIAVMPALGEEVLFRGVVARGLATRLVPWVAIVVSALLFSLFHFAWVQAAPTFLLGLVYGYMALVARSCIPTMIAHLANNTLAILVAQDALPWFTRALGFNTLLTAGVALALTLSGLVLVRRSEVAA